MAALREWVRPPVQRGREPRLGVPVVARFETRAPRTDPPIVFYGTSITYGASASRQRMAHTAILGRRLNRRVVNPGFSGNGRMDAAVGDYLVTIDAAVYVIPCVEASRDPPNARAHPRPLMIGLAAVGCSACLAAVFGGRMPS